MAAERTAEVGLVKSRLAPLLLLIALAACERTVTPPPPTASAVRAAPSRAALDNLEYALSAFDGAKVTLKDGHYEAPPDQPEAERLIASADLHPLSAVGDLDGDGSPDAAVVVASNGGGSGVFHEVIAVLNLPDGFKAQAGVPLGDRIDLKRIEVRSGVIEIEMLSAGPNDALCCPTQRTARAFKLAGARLVETAIPGGSL